MIEVSVPGPTVLYVVMNHVEWVGSFACSIWSSRDLAEAEVLRLMELAGDRADQYDVSEWELDPDVG